MGVLGQITDQAAASKGDQVELWVQSDLGDSTKYEYPGQDGGMMGKKSTYEWPCHLSPPARPP